MADRIPRVLSPRFGVSRELVRKYLRELYPDHPHRTPWWWDDDQAEAVSARLRSLGYTTALPEVDPEPVIVEWVRPADTDVRIHPLDEVVPETRYVSREEMTLQGEFGEWLQATGHPPSTLTLRSGSNALQPDLYVPDLRWVVEAKKSAARQHVRMAIGQVLDYCHLAHAAGLEAAPVILLPECPSSDLVELMHSLGISLAYPSGREFIVAEPIESA